MEIKKELFSFNGLLITILHDVFALGGIGVAILGAWIWTGQIPIGALKSESGYISNSTAVQALVQNNPGYDVKLVPQKEK